MSALRHGHRPAAGFAQAVEDQEIADRRRHAQTGRGRGGSIPWFREAIAGVVGQHDGGTALRLDREHARTAGADHVQRLQLLERLPHPDDAGASAGGIHDRIGQLPAELLGKLEAHGLLAFDAVRLLQRAEVDGAELVANHAGQASAV